MNTFTFSIKTALTEAWTLFKKHIAFFLGIALVSVVLGLGGQKHIHIPRAISIILSIVGYLWSIVWIKVALAAAHNQEHRFSFGSIESFFPTVREIWGVIGLGIAAGIVFIIGIGILGISGFAYVVAGNVSITVLLIAILVFILPGLYVAFRCMFGAYIFVDQKRSFRASLQTSWKMTRKYVWAICRVLFVAGVLYGIGSALYGIVLLVTYPLAAMLMAKLYVALSAHYETPRAVIEQPIEIPAEL